jgi:alpha-L-arabinofuranosidase
MYLPFQNAQLLPISLEAGEYRQGEVTLPQVDAIAAKAKDGIVWLALTNLDPNRSAEVTTSVSGVRARSAIGEVLTAGRLDAVNSFTQPNAVAPMPFTARSGAGGQSLRLPPKSITVVRLEP